MDNTMKVTFSGEIIELTSALLSGKVNDRHGTPTSIYGGPLELDEIHSALYYANRTVIRLLTEEFSVALDNVDEFLVSALTEALTKEWNERNSGDSTVDVKKIIKFRKNQN